MESFAATEPKKKEKGVEKFDKGLLVLGRFRRS
jgi:hypothetical protein